MNRGKRKELSIIEDDCTMTKEEINKVVSNYNSTNESENIEIYDNSKFDSGCVFDK